MPDVDSEADRPAAFAKLEPVLNDAADQFGDVHPVRELALDVVAGLHAHAGQVRRHRSIDAGLHQVAFRDQFSDLWSLDDDLEDAAEAAAVTSTWCGGQAEQNRIGVGGEERLIGLCRAVVAFIDHQQMCERQIHLVGSDCARMKRLDRRHLYRLEWPWRESGLDDAVRDSEVMQLLARLGDNLAPVCEHKHSAP